MSKKALILSDGRKGHENQSIAFCKYKNLDYEIVEVKFCNKAVKLLSYMLDFLGIRARIFNAAQPKGDKFDIVVGTGSGTYYAVKYFARKFGAKSVVMMLPKGYKNDFDITFVMPHDSYKFTQNNILLPTNANFWDENSQSFYTPKSKAIGFIIGGENKGFEFNSSDVFDEIKEIMTKFNGYKFVVTTSPRTPIELEKRLMSLEFEFSVFYSQNQINPIKDFLNYCDLVFITSDSTSMISEAVCNGTAAVEVINNKGNKSLKYQKFIKNLQDGGYLHVYDGSVMQNSKKISLKEIFKGVNI
ncbi:mitochondrial fission ELM1 family protein [Campylobacter sp. faydin G-140]|uniref:ELM1/GtrOC1 family putative glycosyltransferase n=1 Tax=Campylobacter anatolicus TaxID=2829105 RepID=UPI001B925C37|nr:mitochondrial fission ELM1 family protein [Campylobacter anatolicus]